LQLHHRPGTAALEPSGENDCKRHQQQQQKGHDCGPLGGKFVVGCQDGRICVLPQVLRPREAAGEASGFMGAFQATIRRW